MTIEIICPLYHASSFILNLHKSFLMQKNVKIEKISYVLTESNDDTEKIMSENQIFFEKIKKEEFSHSLTREKIAMKSNADILVFVTQDVVIEDELWLSKLTKGIENLEWEAAYSRQVSKFHNIETYTREKNYPKNSFTVSKEDIKDLGLKTFFFSDAASAIKKDVFVKLNGYDGKDLPTNEDMYFAYKLIMNGYKIHYCAEAIVYHSHNFRLKELYKRYYITGQFFRENSYLDQYGTTKSGGGLAKYILKRAIQEKNLKVLLRYPFDMGVRLIGMKVGKRSERK